MSHPAVFLADARATCPRLTALMSVAVLLTACSPKTQGELPVLKVASQRGGTKSMVLASHSLDGAPYQVVWSEFPSAQTLLEALGAGAVDAGAVGDAPFVFAYAAGSRIKAVQATRSVAGGAYTAILVRSDSAIRTPADLKGKRIATGRGSIGHYLLIRELEKAGLSPKDVSLVFLGPGDAKAAFDGGAVDAWVAWSSYVGLAVLHDHARIVADGRGLLTGITFEVATDTAIASKRAQLTDFLRRLDTAAKWATQHREAYGAILAKETGLPADVALYTANQIRGVPTAIDASVIADERETMNHFLKAGVIQTAPNIDGAFDSSFNADDLAPIFGPPRAGTSRLLGAGRAIWPGAVHDVDRALTADRAVGSLLVVVSAPSLAF